MKKRKTPLESFYDRILAYHKKEIVNKSLKEIFQININIFFNKN